VQTHTGNAMSHQDYERSRELADTERFFSLIMAAMRRADSVNEMILRAAFPAVWQQLQERYNAPGGLLPGEKKD